MGFFERMTGREVSPESQGLDLDKLQAALERIASSLESINEKLNRRK